MTPAKRKVSVSLDEDLVEALEAEAESLSAQVNSAVRDKVQHAHRQRLLAELLARLDEEQGPVGPALVDKYIRLLE